jgi:F-type H+-transporting ATPase subunit gamma
VAGGQERVLRRRIRSVQATKKITRAMELIAASRIVKAQQRVQAAVPYSEQITEVVRDLAAAGGEVSSPLLVPQSNAQRVAFVVCVSDRGQCGAYNSQVIRAAEGEIKRRALEGLDYELVLVGRKAEAYFKFRHYRIDAAYQGFTQDPSYEDARMVARHALGLFESGRVQAIELVYTRYVTSGFQEVVRRPFVPLDAAVVAAEAGVAHGGAAAAAEAAGTASYEFEPGPGAILQTLLPRYVEARMYAALLNAAASEHAARQRAMKAATDNAEEVIRNLSRIMNRARQDAITTEIMEIVGGAEALGKS